MIRPCAPKRNSRTAVRLACGHVVRFRESPPSKGDPVTCCVCGRETRALGKEKAKDDA